MPFTASHPAAVLPLARLGLPASALIIGSMVPDLPFYLPLPVSAATTHSAAGVAGVDILFGALLLIGWHGLIAPFLVGAAPARLRARLPTPTSHAGTLPDAVTLIIGLAFGGGTHIAWDAFTHPDRWGSRHVAWLADSHAGMPGYHWAQYASSVIGLALLAIAALRWYQRTSPRSAPPQPAGFRFTSWPPPHPSPRAIIAACAAATCAGLASVVVTMLDMPLGTAPHRVLFLTGTHAAGTAAATFLLCTIPHRRTKSHSPPVLLIDGGLSTGQ